MLSESAAVAVKVLDFCLGIATLTSNSVKLLKVSLELSPAYAMTAHSSQGKTLVAVLLDLHVDKRVDPTIGTVAATRVRSRYDVLILRPVPSWLYQRKPSDGPQLLLQQLCGANIDWPAYRSYRESRKPSATCSRCEQVLQVDSFTHEHWEHVRANMPAMCTACKNGHEPKHKRKLHADILEKILCIGCDRDKIADAFPRAQLVQARAETQCQCLKCLQAQRTEMQCRRCSQSKDAPELCTPNGHPAIGWHPMPAVSGRVAATDAQIKGKRRWFLHLSNLFPNLSCSGRHWQEMKPSLHKRCIAKQQKERRANLSQCCL